MNELHEAALALLTAEPKPFKDLGPQLEAATGYEYPFDVFQDLVSAGVAVLHVKQLSWANGQHRGTRHFFAKAA